MIHDISHLTVSSIAKIKGLGNCERYLMGGALGFIQMTDSGHSMSKVHKFGSIRCDTIYFDSHIHSCR